MEFSSVCNHTSDNKIGPAQLESDMLVTSMITDELDGAKSYYELIMKITISEKRKIAKLCKKGKICIKIPTKEA